MGNQFKTAFLLTIMTLFVIFIGSIIGGRGGMLIAFVIAVGMNVFSYWYSDKLVLKMYRAEEVTRSEAPELYVMVEDLVRRASLPMPKVYIIPEEAPNAFATGRNPENAVVAVTHGLLNLMSPEEIKGVLAHELGHIKNRDILIGTIAATMAGAVMILANMAQWAAIFGGSGRDEEDGPGAFGLIITAIIAPIAASLIQMAISRSREYLADSTAAYITGNPEGLASALEKLGVYSGRIPMDAKPETAHMFISNPLSGQSFTKLFSTHPPIEDRVAKLRGGSHRNFQERSNASDTLNQDASDFWNNMRR